MCSYKKKVCDDQGRVKKESEGVCTGYGGMGLERKSKKGKGKEKENGNKWKRNEDAEDRELEIESSWQSFVTAKMVMMGLVLDKLQREMNGCRRRIQKIGGIFLGRLERYGRT